LISFCFAACSRRPSRRAHHTPQNELLLVSPALWDALPPDLRAVDRVIDPHVSIILEDLEQLRSTMACWGLRFRVSQGGGTESNLRGLLG
jgi:hypothetical protein